MKLPDGFKNLLPEQWDESDSWSEYVKFTDHAGREVIVKEKHVESGYRIILQATEYHPDIDESTVISETTAGYRKLALTIGIGFMHSVGILE